MSLLAAFDPSAGSDTSAPFTWITIAIIVVVFVLYKVGKADRDRREDEIRRR
jgi:hypothetical protein